VSVGLSPVMAWLVSMVRTISIADNETNKPKNQGLIALSATTSLFAQYNQTKMNGPIILIVALCSLLICPTDIKTEIQNKLSEQAGLKERNEQLGSLGGGDRRRRPGNPRAITSYIRYI
jgi:hypothetical protein